MLVETTTTTIGAIGNFIAKYSPQWSKSLQMMGFGIIWLVIGVIGIYAGIAIIRRMLKKDIEEGERIRIDLSKELSKSDYIVEELKGNTESIHKLQALKIPDIRSLVKDITALKSRKPPSVEHLVSNESMNKTIGQFNINLEILQDDLAGLGSKLDKAVVDMDTKLGKIKKLIGELDG